MSHATVLVTDTAQKAFAKEASEGLKKQKNTDSNCKKCPFFISEAKKQSVFPSLMLQRFVPAVNIQLTVFH